MLNRYIGITYKNKNKTIVNSSHNMQAIVRYILTVLFMFPGKNYLKK